MVKVSSAPANLSVGDLIPLTTGMARMSRHTEARGEGGWHTGTRGEGAELPQRRAVP